MKRGLFVPPFDNLADPNLITELAVRSEAIGWDGFFLWDHIQYSDPIEAMCDPWVCMAAIASATERIRIGAMVTPLARRRPQVVARQAATLDLLSGGRMTLGLSVGGDSNGEMAELGEAGEMKTRAAMLDEGLELLDSMLSGDPIAHHGTHYSIDSKPFLPKPVQAPRIPVWLGARWRDPLPDPLPRPLRRAAAWDGLFPDGVDPDGIALLRERTKDLRPPGAAPLTLVASTRTEDDPALWERAGVDWLLTDLGPRQPDWDVRPMQPIEAIEAAIEAL